MRRHYLDIDNVSLIAIVDAFNRKTWNTSFWRFFTAKEREDYIEYMERNQGAWNTVQVLCELLNIDREALFATVKALNHNNEIVAEHA